MNLGPFLSSLGAAIMTQRSNFQFDKSREFIRSFKGLAKNAVEFFNLGNTVGSYWL